MSKKICFALILAVLFVLPSVALAQVEWWPIKSFFPSAEKSVLELFFGPNIPSEFTDTPYLVLQWLIFPFLSLWMIFYGILSEIRLFRRKTWINGALAFLIAAISGPTGGLVYLVRILFVSYGVFGLGVFIVLLFVGTFLWGASMFWHEWGFKGGPGKALERFQQQRTLMTQIEELRATLAVDPGNERASKLLEEKVKELDRKKKEVT